MSRVTYQITVWSIYRSTTNTYFHNHKLGVRPIHGSTTNTHVDSHKLGLRPIHRCNLYARIYGNGRYGDKSCCLLRHAR